MAADDEPLAGTDLLDAVTASMVGLHKRYHHREPVTAKTQMMGDDMIACVLGGVYSDVEKTMIEIQRSELVHETRSEFQAAMEETFIAEIERLSGRRVIDFISNSVVGPDLEIEIFMLEPVDDLPVDAAH